MAEPTPLSPERLAAVREQVKQALSTAGAFCGGWCGFEPGDRGQCADCERHWDSCADALLPIVTTEAERLTARDAEWERDLDEVLAERDAMYERLDRMAYAVAPIEVIGEHSSANDPWAEALELITPAAEVERLTGEVERLARWHAEDAREINRLRARVTEMTADRDRARDIAVALEQENDALESRPSRADVLREAADHLAAQAEELWTPGRTAHTVMHADAAELRRMADTAEAGEER